MANRGASLQTETAMSGQQGIAGRFRPHSTVAQDKMRQNREDRPASGALNAPDGEAAETNTGIMGVASQRAAAITGRFVVELETQREDESQDELDEGSAIAEQLKVGRLTLKSTVIVRFSRVALAVWAMSHLHAGGSRCGCDIVRTRH
jgi:hypothetical protein